MIMFTQLVLWRLENSHMWDSFHSREGIQEDVPLPVFGPMWRWSKICEFFKKREREKIELVFPNRADSSVVADVFPSLIIKLQRLQQTIAKLSQMAAHTWGRSDQLSTGLIWIGSIFWLSLQEAGQIWPNQGYRYIEGTGNLTMNNWARLFDHWSCNQYVQVASHPQLCLVYLRSLESGAAGVQCEIN